MKVYIVRGETGEYSDKINWAVDGYFRESSAHERANNAKNRADEIKRSRNNLTNRNNEPKLDNEFDPGMEMDYTGTNYWVETIDIVDASMPPWNWLIKEYCPRTETDDG